jgi:thiamine biosynthesis lipoprotein ApbE
LVRASLATSARYERGDHLVDLLDTGSATRILSTTILSSKATEADFLSTTVALVGPENAAQVLRGQPGSSAVILVEGEEEPRIIGQIRGE